jgi:hypothetical protein
MSDSRREHKSKSSVVNIDSFEQSIMRLPLVDSSKTIQHFAWRPIGNHVKRRPNGEENEARHWTPRAPAQES